MLKQSQERHLNRIKRAFTDLVDAKYRAGQKEHGGNLWDHSPAWFTDQGIEEVIDLFSYLYSQKERLETYRQEIIQEILDAGYDEDFKTHSPDSIFEYLMSINDPSCVKEAREILEGRG